MQTYIRVYLINALMLSDMMNFGSGIGAKYEIYFM